MKVCILLIVKLLLFIHVDMIMLLHWNLLGDKVGVAQQGSKREEEVHYEMPREAAAHYETPVSSGKVSFIVRDI